MKKHLIAATLASLAIASHAIASHAAELKTEQFTGSVLTEGLDAPWDMQWGADDQLWLTERQGKRITRVNPQNGEKQTVITLDEVHTGPQHEGLLGFTFSPAFAQDHYLYTAYTYMDGNHEHTKIIRLTYDPNNHTAGAPHTIIDKLPAGTDHNAGRLRFGPDGKLYYTIGELGHNQGKHRYEPIEAQRLPSQQELDAKGYSAYVGKTLRLEADGSIPADNPQINGVRSHVYTYGHRNPQGLVFVDDKPYSVEHGPNSDDEINLLQPGGNYGWSHVAGYRDNQAYEYTNYSLSKTRPENGEPTDVKPEKETDWTAPMNEPLKIFHTVNNDYRYKDDACGELTYVCWPTIAPASVTYYPENGANPYWHNSLVITALKNGAVYVVPLNSSKDNVQGDVRTYFHSANRYRVAALNPKGDKIYIATDVKGNVVGMDGKHTGKLANPGAILEFTYQP